MTSCYLDGLDRPRPRHRPFLQHLSTYGRCISQRPLTPLPAPSHPHAVLSWGCGYSWTALPLQASVGSKLRTAARGLTLRPTSECVRCGFRWRICGRSLKTGNGLSA
jgi:hypothetical protein